MGMTPAEKSARYRAKDVDAYRAQKAEYAKTPEQREVRRLYMQRWREENREKHNASARASYAKHRDKRASKSQELHFRRTFGLSIEQRDGMIAAQEGKCAICRNPFKDSRGAHVDHCHETGRVRGLLCQPCNTRLGWFETNRDAINGYLTW